MASAFDVINVIGKDEVLTDCPEQEGKPAYTDKPIVHDYLRMMKRSNFWAGRFLYDGWRNECNDD